MTLTLTLTFTLTLLAKALLKLDFAASIAALIQIVQIVRADEEFYQVAGFGVAAFNFAFLLLAWACLQMEWGRILCSCAPVMLVQPGYLLWYAMYELYLTESCGRTLMDDEVCPAWNLTMSARDNCMHCGFKDVYDDYNLSATGDAPPSNAYKCLVNCGTNNLEVGCLGASGLSLGS